MLDEINLLRTLLAVADGGSHRAAAAALGVTASAVSQQLKVLDARLGAPLFERIGRRSVLTTDGRAFVEQIRRPFDELQEAVRQHRERDVGLAGPVRIGAASGFFAAWLRPRLVPLLQDHPALRLEARIGTLGALPALLEEGALDLAMAVGAVDSTALDSAPLYRQRFVLVGTPEQMGTDPRRSAAKLRDAPFIVFDHERFLLRRWWRAVFGAREALPNAAAHHIGNIFELRAFVEAGMGLAVLPLFFARDALAAGTLVQGVPITDEGRTIRKACESTVSLLWRRSRVEPERVRFVRTALLNDHGGVAQSPRYPLRGSITSVE